MPTISVTRFGGLLPAVGERLLNADRATIAHNTKLHDGTLRPYCKPLTVKTHDGVVSSLWQPERVEDCCPPIFCRSTCAAPVLSVTPQCGGFGWAAVFDDGQPGYRYNVCTEERAPLCVPRPLNAMIGTRASPGTSPDYTGPGERIYTYTWVDQFGIESPPADPTYLGQAEENSTWTLSGFAVPPAHVTEVRIYRMSEPYNLQGSVQIEPEFILVDEVPPATTTYLDDNNLMDIDGSTLLTMDECCPPENLRGVRETDMGYLVGFVGNMLYFSERNEPHNWPDRNHFTLTDTIVGLEVSGDTVYVGTVGRPYRILVGNGTDPLTQEAALEVAIGRYEMVAPLINHRAIVATPTGGVIASDDGLYTLGDGASNMSRLRIEDTDYDDYRPHALLWVNGRLFGSKWPTGKGWVMDVRADGQFDIGDLVTLDYSPLSHTHANDGRHLIGNEDGTVQEWDASHEPLTYRWRSKCFMAQGDLGMAAARVRADYGKPVTFRFYQDSALVVERVVEDNEPFLLPRCGRGTKFEIELEGTTRVHSVAVATSIRELTASQQ